MCGLNLILDRHGKLGADPIRRMVAATRHRGPDASGIQERACGQGRIWFGHNRLKIIDTSDQANQPFRSDDGRYLLVYNGEVYNYRELRRELQSQGCLFRTESDTEVILQLLVSQGSGALARLKGMFALAFYDTWLQQLWLARDPFGIKPLYYADTRDYLVVSSSIPGILAAGLVPKELLPGQVQHYLRFRHAAGPQTFYRHIQALPLGGLLSWQAGRPVPDLSRDAGPAPGPAVPFPALVGKTEELLQASVQRHLVADVPLGLFLSGGIDSTLLLALLHQAGHRHFPAFSITHAPADRSFGTDDGHFARLAARLYQAEHTCFEVKETLLQETDAWVASLDQPIADSAGLLTAYLSRQVKPHIRVALSGAGADELFGGYNRHRAFALYLQYHQLVRVGRTGLQPLAGLLPTAFAHPWRKQAVLLRKLAYKLQDDPGQTFLNFTSMDRQLHALWRLADQQESLRPQQRSQEEWLRWALHHDQHHYLADDVLALTDGSGMSQGLEVRTPYLDPDLAGFLACQPAGGLFRGGQKWILKQILARHQGAAFLKRPKEGFGLPLGRWLRRPGNRHLFAELQDSSQPVYDFIGYEATRQLLDRHQSGRQDLSAEVWALVVLAKWLHKNFS
ncbi:MAG: asparagine synthase (glutamine-hydrolyzing) [Adhaeribacter sp.]